MIAMACCLLINFSKAQDVETSQNDEDLLGLSLEDLMDVVIVSASKKEEKAFEAPLTSFVVTRKDIYNHGFTSIPEALRLAPGLIVREISNGSYDVSIRGGNTNMPSNKYTYDNTSILVMIDNRPVFNYLEGGTFWQNLPIGIADVERIEVVYGPNAPLYGPNAVSGTINIITRRTDRSASHATANVMVGRDQILSAYADHKVNDKLRVIMSANHASRNRFGKEIYDPAVDNYVSDRSQYSDEGFSTNYYEYFPAPDRSISATGVNLGFDYEVKEDIKIFVNSGYNNSMAIRPLTVGTSMSTFFNESNNHMVRADIKNTSVQYSLINGKQGLLGNIQQYGYDYRTHDIYIDHNFVLWDKLSVRPAISYQDAMINDRRYTVDRGLKGVFNDNATMENIAGSIKLDYSPIEKLRLISAVRVDRFKHPSIAYPSYQFIANYKLNTDHILRAQMSKSNNGSFISNAFVNFNAAEVPLNAGPFNRYVIRATNNKELLLPSNTLYEIGYRGQIKKNLMIDLSCFQQVFNNFIGNIMQTPEHSFADATIYQDMAVHNIAAVATQRGAMLSLHFSTSDRKLSFRPNVMIQKTQLSDYSPYPFTTGANAQRNQEVRVDSVLNSDPSIISGFALNYSPIKRFNVGLTGYYFSNYHLKTRLNHNTTTGEITALSPDRISAKTILNVNLSYNISESISAFCNVRNLLDQNSRESWATDRVGRNVLFGLLINY